MCQDLREINFVECPKNEIKKIKKLKIEECLISQ